MSRHSLTARIFFDADTEIKVKQGNENPDGRFHTIHLGDLDLTAYNTAALYALLSALESYLHGVREEDLHDSPDWLGNLPHEEVVPRE